jgi:rhodanese-related sulfurtransferase
MFGFIKKDDGKVIHVNDLDNLIGQVELIDIREIYEYQSGSIQTAKNIPMGNLISEPSKYMEKDKTYYIMCQSGVRSNMTTKELTKQGFNVINVAGGMGSYVGTKRQ